MQQFSFVQPRLNAAWAEGVMNCEHIRFSAGVNASVEWKLLHFGMCR
jgi:hypothetical protein